LVVVRSTLFGGISYLSLMQWKATKQMLVHATCWPRTEPTGSAKSFLLALLSLPFYTLYNNILKLKKFIYKL
jgi:hypothetical protein